MCHLKLTVILVCVLAVFAERDETKSRDKRQHLSFHSRRIGRPPPYAVQMEPIAQYSQRDPLYNPLAESKIDNQSEYYEESPYNYYPTEPEPIIEIIIKESNESLPTTVPPTPPPTPKPKKEPIQVFYVKYEKKQGYGDEKPRVVYDTPIPALTPVEDHEEIKQDKSEAEGYPLQPVIPPSPSEPSTTLRTVIRPDSEIYHSGNSGIRVTFGTEQIPPNNHNKRSDKETSGEVLPNKPTILPTPGSSKRPHGPFAPIQPIPQHIPSAFPQQRIVNSFPQQQLLGTATPHHSGPPPNFSLQQQFHQPIPPHIRNQYQQLHSNQRPQQRPPITVQGLPEVQQRLPFNSFVSQHHLNVNHPQQLGPTQPLSISHQNVQLTNFQQQLPANQPPSNFHFDPQIRYKQQREQEKQRYLEQQRLLEQRQQEQKRLQEQQRLQDLQRQQDQQRQQEQQRQLEHQRQIEQQRQVEQQRQLEQQRQQEQQEHQRQQQYIILEQQRRKHEQEQQKLRAQQQQEQQYKFGQIQQSQQSQSELSQKQLGAEILRAVPKLEQHYAIRENPLHPGPFPPNPQFTEASQTPHESPLTNTNQHSGSLQQFNLVQQSQQPLSSQRNIKQNSITLKEQEQQQKQQEPIYQNQQSFFLQNLPRSQQQITQESLPQSSILGRPVFQNKIVNTNQKVYATTKTINESIKYSASTPKSIRHSPTTPRTTTIAVSTTQSTTTPLTTTTLSPKKEAKIKENIANLPDEVPDDIREQLLSSGILGNADIQILDYDKVGGINIGDLPPEALANFYGAGGAAATAASEPVPQIAKRPKIMDEEQDESEVQIAASSSNIGENSVPRRENQVQTEEITLRPGGVEMKVVRFDPNTTQGQTIAERHISDNATRLNPVAVGEREPVDNNGQYNRYLPLKVSGASFPIPSVPELSGKRITSVVVLAPVDYNFQPEAVQSTRQNRKIANDIQSIRFLAGDSLKQLVKKPSAENYKRWLDQERQTEPQRQSVVLLVTTPNDSSETEKEIFMYDVSSETVSKLAGDLSTAFVDAAESNSDSNENPMVDIFSTAS